MKVKRNILALVGSMMLLPMNAQQLIIETTDTAITSNCLFATPEGEYYSLVFNSKGVATYDNKNIKEKASATLMLQDGTMFVAICEPGKSQKLKLSRNKAGKVEYKFSGANTDLSELFSEFTLFIVDADFNGNIDINKKYVEESKSLAERYARLVKMANKLKDADEAKANLNDIEKTYLYNRLTLLESKDYATDKNPRNDEEYMKLIGEINPNDTLFLYRDLVSTFVRAHFPERISKELPVEKYGIDFINTVDKYINNKAIKDLLMENIINTILGVSTPFDIDSFWNVAKEKADKSIIARFQYIVDSKKKIKAGMPCPDITFSDAEGNKHHLSEYKGKLLYIDLWATWCGPCVMEIPKLANHVEEYKNNDKVQFISISLDENIKAWQNKIGKDKPQWPQFIANAEENKVISETFGVMSIPRFILINPDGTICNAEAFRPSDKEYKEKLDAVLQ